MSKNIDVRTSGAPFSSDLSAAAGDYEDSAAPPEQTLPTDMSGKTVGLSVKLIGNLAKLSGDLGGAPRQRAHLGRRHAQKRDGKTHPVRQITHERLLASAQSLLHADFAGVRATSLLGGRRCLSVADMQGQATAIGRTLRAERRCVANLM